MKIALRAQNGLIVSSWDVPHTLIANRTTVGIGEQFELLAEVNGQWVPFELAPIPTPPSPPQPQPPQPISPSYHAGMNPEAWFRSIVINKPFGQQTVLDVEPVLNANGWLLTPPNAVGDRTKVKPPDYPNYFRVGFGEGHWVWLAQSV